MVRAGLGPGWKCVFANDICPKKAAAYGCNWGSAELRVSDVAAVSPASVPGAADLSWASFPCQDLSLAGVGGGLGAARSGAFWPYWRLVERLGAEGRAPRLVVLENVYGALTSHGGKDFAAIAAALARGGYRFGPLIIDAAAFVPQSRPRLFIVAADKRMAVPGGLAADGPLGPWHPASVLKAFAALTPPLRRRWLWWALPTPPPRRLNLEDIVEEEAEAASWRPPAETERLLGLMTPVHLDKVRRAQRAGRRIAGALYKRTRQGQQRAEARFDGLAGCLRTPGGGSSRQTLLLVDGGHVQSRLFSPRETARLMGLPDTYALPDNPNAAYHLTGDGVVVPVVRWLADHLLEPLLRHNTALAPRSQVTATPLGERVGP